MQMHSKQQNILEQEKQIYLLIIYLLFIYIDAQFQYSIWNMAVSL